MTRNVSPWNLYLRISLLGYMLTELGWSFHQKALRTTQQVLVELILIQPYRQVHALHSSLVRNRMALQGVYLYTWNS